MNNIRKIPSQLVSILEYLTASLIAVGGDEDSARRARIAVSGLTAQPLSNAFFSVVAEFETSDWSENDREIIKKCRKEIDLLISRRNRSLHDVWHLGHPNFPRPSLVSWNRTRTLGTPNKGYDVQHEEVSIESLNVLTKDSQNLLSIVSIISLVGIAGESHRPELLLRIETSPTGAKVVKLSDG